MTANLKNSNNSILGFYYYIINEKEDPRVKHWFFISSPLPSFLIIVSYLLLIYKILPKYMQNRNPFQLKNTIRLYNLLQVAICLYIVYQTVTPLSNPLVVWKCEYFTFSTDLKSLRRVHLSLFWHILKAFELVETIFFVLRKKYSQVTALHVYHHISTFFISWYFGKYFSGGLASFCHMLNSSVHAAMYTYYFLATLGPVWQKRISKFKPVLTFLQIVQLFALIAHSSQIVLNKDCNLPHIAFYLYGPNVAIMFYMFIQFYWKSYRKNLKKTE